MKKVIAVALVAASFALVACNKPAADTTASGAETATGTETAPTTPAQ